MSAGQGETGSLVIELTGLPLDVVMTGFAPLAFGHCRKLAGMNVLVTTRASERRALEYNLMRPER